MPRQSAVPSDIYARPKKPTSFFMLIAVLIFVFCLVSMGGLYAYKIYLTGANVKKDAQVKEAIANFEPALISQLSIIKSRMDSGKKLLDNHRALSQIFSLLSTSVAQPVRIKEFTYAVAPDSKNTLTMKGEARSYNDIAFQSDVLSRIESFKSPVVSNLVLDDKGVISFDFNTEVEPSVVAYRKLVPVAAPAAPAAPATPASSATTTPAAATSTPPVATSTPRQ